MNFLLTGSPGIGKTTAIHKIIQRLGDKCAGGFFSREIREAGRRVGFMLITLDNREGILAHVDLPKQHRVGKYGVSVENIDSYAVSSLQLAKKKPGIIVIDEIAAMELKSPRFKDEVIKCLDVKRVLGTIQMRNIPFLNRIRERNDVRLVHLTYENREKIHEEVSATLLEQ